MSSPTGLERWNRSPLDEADQPLVRPHPRHLLQPGWVSRTDAVILVLLTALFTAMIVQASLRHGRLMFYPQPDDPTYLVDGLERLQTFYDGGPIALGGSLLRNPPHSPFSTAIALGSYLVFGTHTWAPYAGNSVIVLSLLLFIHLFVWDRPLWQRLCGYLLALSFPIAVNAIHEFRPDVASCLFAACAMALCLPLATGDLRPVELLIIGGLAGISVLMKPTFAPYNLFLAGFAALAASAFRTDLRWRDRVFTCLRSEGWILLAALAVCLPYMLWSAHYFLQYIYENAFGSYRDLWTIHEGWAGQLHYFIDGVGGSMMLGRHIYLVGVLFVAGLAGLFLRSAPAYRRTFLLLLLLILVAYAIPTVNAVKNGFSAGVFFFLLLFGCFYVLMENAWTKRPWALVAALMAGLILFQVRQEWGKWTPRVQARNLLVETSHDIIRRHAISLAATGENRKLFVFLTTFGFSHNLASLYYLLKLDGVDNVQFIDLHRTTDPGSYRLALEQADLVVANTAGGEEPIGFLPSSQQADRTLAEVRDSGRFALIRPLRLLDGTTYFYFEHKNLRHAEDGLAGAEMSASPAPVCALKAPVPR